MAARSEHKQRVQDFKALQSALKTGDLAGAQTAFASFQKDLQNASQTGGKRPPLDPNSQAGQDIQALETALKSGDIDSAQKAFAAFRLDIQAANGAQGGQSAGHVHHHRHPDNDGDGDDSGQTSGVAPPSPSTNQPTTLSLNQLA